MHDKGSSYPTQTLLISSSWTDLDDAFSIFSEQVHLEIGMQAGCRGRGWIKFHPCGGFVSQGVEERVQSSYLRIVQSEQPQHPLGLNLTC